MIHVSSVFNVAGAGPHVSRRWFHVPLVIFFLTPHTLLLYFHPLLLLPLALPGCPCSTSRWWALFLCQYLYFGTSKVSKLSTCSSSCFLLRQYLYAYASKGSKLSTFSSSCRWHSVAFRSRTSRSISSLSTLPAYLVSIRQRVLPA